MHLIEECGVPQRDGERLPTRLRDAAVECRQVTKLRSTLSQLFPQSPTAAVNFRQLSGRWSSNPGWRHRHGAVLDKDKVALIHDKLFVFGVSQTIDAGHAKLAIFGLVVEVCYIAIGD